MGNENGLDDKTTEKPMFTKGGKPGPGRPPAKQSMLELLEDTVKKGLRSKNISDRLKAAGIAIRLQGVKNKESGEVQLDPIIMDLLDKCSDLDLSDYNFLNDDEEEENE
jgi:hypothetical protein